MGNIFKLIETNGKTHINEKFIISRILSKNIEIGIYSLNNALCEGLKINNHIYNLSSIIETDNLLTISGDHIELILKKIDDKIIYKLKLRQSEIYVNSINKEIRSKIKNIDVNSPIIDKICNFIKT